MPKELTFDDVCREQIENLNAADQTRVVTGLNLFLGPNATPEGIRGILNDIFESERNYMLFSAAERAQAENARLRAVLRKVARKCQTDVSEWDVPVDGRALKLEIFRMVDLVPHASWGEDLDWMVAERKKRGQPLPEGFRLQTSDLKCSEF